MDEETKIILRRIVNAIEWVVIALFLLIVATCAHTGK